jgi:hypothetical protein
MVRPAAGDRSAASAGGYVLGKRGLVFVGSSVLALAFACGPQDALVEAEDPDGKSGKVGAGTSGAGSNVGSKPNGSTQGGSSTGKAGEPPLGGTGEAVAIGGADEGTTTGGTGGTSEAPNVGGSTSTAGGGGGGHTCEAASDGSIAPCEVVGALDGRLMQFPCAESPVTDDCRSLGYVVDGVVTTCVGGQSEMVLDHPITGTPGTHYLVKMHFYGIMEPKTLGAGVTREAAPDAPDRSGGSPSPWATAPAGTSSPISSTSAYELHVHDEGGQEVAQYFVNADVEEGHWTLLIDYEKTIEVVAGGFVRLRRYDPDCQIIKNCGALAGPPCASKARTIDLSAAEPPPPSPGAFPMGFNQPGLNQNAENAGQWWMIDVTEVEPI